MKKLIVFLFANALLLKGFGQSAYWQQEVNYTINVSLDDTAHSLSGFEKIEYINHSPDTLKFIWFHLWPNAYKNDKTAFTDQRLLNGDTKFYFSDKEQKGYINRLDFRVDNITVLVEDHPQHIDIVKLILPAPLLPGQKTVITTPFHVRLPYNFSRAGHVGQSYQGTQWYPKPAVYDKNGWHPMPYLDQGEFYSEFGNFDVNITVPQNYIVAATGELQNPLPQSSGLTKTLKYKQNNIHDFAWFADKNFLVNHDTVILKSGKIVDVFAYYLQKDSKTWQNAVQSGKNAIAHYSEFVGEYPYNTVSIVEGPESFGGGMEYPTITVISPTSDLKELDITIVHEVGHNWFYGILATNERDHPWMDEGVNSFYDEKYRRSKYGDYAKLERIGFETKVLIKKDQPIDLGAEQYPESNYDFSVYYKTSEWLRYMESELGADVINKAMLQYFSDWKFKHPQPEDFKYEFEKAAGKNLDNEFSYLHTNGLLPNQQRKGVKTNLVFNIKGYSEYLKNPTKELISYGPAFGINSYDKIMIGAFITNLKLPPSPFQYFLAPMYATGSKSFAGLGFATYSIYQNGFFRSLDFGISASHFTAREFTDDNGKKNDLGFSKIVGGIKLTLKEKDALSTFDRFIQFKSFYITEEGLHFFRDTTSPGPPPVIVNKYSIANSSRSLQQLRFVIENNRALYPYGADLKLESGKYFVRLGLTGNYFFNYPKGGGLKLRLFGGKFFYTGSKTSTKQFATDRFHLNLSGPDGTEDYDYSDYFAGRSHFSKWQSQQMMVRDGAFKVRTDFLSQKVGKTDDWLVAANFTSNIPKSINPFMLLPVKVPVKLFLDIGTYAESWKQDAQTDRFLFDAGLYIPFLNDIVNIYIPVFYSSVYSEYYKSTIAKKERFWKKISFSINISNFNFRKIERNLNF